MKVFMVFVSFILIANWIYAGVNVIPEKDNNGKIVNKNDPFSAKSSYNFRGTGIECVVAATSVTVCEYAVTDSQVKFNGIHIINSSVGDKANLKVLDTAAGTYSTVPNYTLNQFGFDWNLGTEVKEVLPYPSDLYQGMRIAIEYNNQGPSKTVYMNFYLHKE